MPRAQRDRQHRGHEKPAGDAPRLPLACRAHEPRARLRREDEREPDQRGVRGGQDDRAQARFGLQRAQRHEADPDRADPRDGMPGAQEMVVGLARIEAEGADKNFGAERFGVVVDRFGITWLINCGG